ncbi:hypothetical protein PCANC_05137 [Puccinia coronata f. sp. avenae]|uniref:Uncharacterized protein n=1 Tax=Puccinia coronata f. sp. avenae TaxID=200324 RepID=A0A2N5W367_9BASI|nr:hypothetical protein PCANC_05137 [Puccinia coronata f. sp. avenae]
MLVEVCQKYHSKKPPPKHWKRSRQKVDITYKPLLRRPRRARGASRRQAIPGPLKQEDWVKLAQRAGLHACKAGTSPASRPTCSPSWYQPSEQAYLLAELVPAQQAGLPARRAGTSPARRPTCSPSWYQLSGQVLLLITGLSGLPGGARSPLDDRDRRVIKRRKTTLDDRYRPVIKRSAYSSQ